MNRGVQGVPRLPPAAISGMRHMVDLQYAYANARVKALKSKLFDRDRMRELMDAPSLTEAIEMLEESPYKNAFVKASTRLSGIEMVKAALDDDLKATFRKVLRFAPAKAKPLLSLLVRQWEADNLKKAIAAKALGRKLSLSDLLVVEGENSSLLQKVLAAEDLQAIAAALAHSPYGPSFRKAFGQYRRHGDFRLLLAAIDSQYLESLYKQVAFGKMDAKTPEAFLAKKLEYGKAMAVLRMRHSGMAGAQVKKFFEGGTGSKLSRSRSGLHNTPLVLGVLNAESAQAAVELLSRQRLVDGKAMMQKYALKDLPGVEAELEKALLAFSRKTLGASVLSLGAILGYLYLKQEEVRSIRKIAYATQFDAKQEIRDNVLAAV